MDCGLNELFSLLGSGSATGNSDANINVNSGSVHGAACLKQEDLFGFSAETPCPALRYEQTDIDIAAELFSNTLNPSSLCEPARRLHELSANAFAAFVYAWMSELPIKDEMLAYGRMVINTAGKASGDRGDENARIVMAAAYKVEHEIHRLLGLLRFNPDNKGVYIALCEPDHFVLPAFGEHFTSRFGQNTAWAIIDEKRGLVLSRELACSANARAEILSKNDYILLNCSDEQETGPGLNKAGGYWEDLWLHYHKTINNKDRSNPNLQRQFMPKRYWKYLPEV